MYNRYKGNSGYVQKVEDGHERPRPGRQSQPRRVLLPLTDEPPKEKRQEKPKTDLRNKTAQSAFGTERRIGQDLWQAGLGVP